MPSLGDMFVTVGAKIDGFERAMGTVGQRLRAIDRDVNRTFSGFDKIGDKLSTIGQAMSVGVTLPLAAAGVAVTKMAADFDLGLRKVGSLVGGFTDGEMKRFTEQTLALSRSLGVDAVKATDALYEAISAGVPKDNAMDFLAVASKAAIAGVTDTKVAVDGLTSIINAYGLSTKDAKTVSDQMFQAVNIGKFTFEQLAGSISIATPLAAKLGIDFAQLGAAAATLTSQGFSVAEAMTSVRSVMVALETPNKAMNLLLEQTGFASGDALLKTKGLQGAVEALAAAANGNNEILATAYGRVEALGAGLGLTGDKAQKARTDLDSVRHASDGLGAATAAFNEINKSSTRQFEMVVAAIKATAIELGVALLPAVNNLLRASQPLIQMLAEAVQWFTALPTSVQTTILGFTAAVAVIGPMTLALGTLISTITQVSAAFVSLASISGVQAAITALSQIPAMLPNVIFALQNNLVGALSGTELALARMGQAAILAAGAFIGWKLGSWAYEQIPGVKALGDAIGDLLLKIPGIEAATLKLSGAAGKLADAQKDAEFATKKLEEALKKKGVTVDKTGLTTEQYAAKLKAAAKDAGLLGTAHDTARAKVDEAKKQLKAADEQTKTYQKAMKELGKEVQSTGSIHRHAKDEIKLFGDGIPAALVAEYERRVKSMRTEVAKSALDHTMAKAAGRDWESQVWENIEAAQKLNDSLVTTAKVKMPEYIAGIGSVKEAIQGLTPELKRAADAGVYEFGTAAEIIARHGGSIKNSNKAAVDASIKDWKDFGRDVSTVFTNFAQDIAKSLFDGDLSFGEKAKKMLSSLGEAVVAKFIEPATKAIGNFISGVLSDLLSGKGLGGIIDKLKDIGEGIGKVFGIGADAASAAGTVANTAGSAAGTAGSTATSVAGAVGSGLTGVVGAIGSVVTAVSSIISNFQLARQENTLNAIEESTRYIKIWTGEQSQNMLWCLQTITERSGYLVTALDSIGRFASEQLGWLERIGAAVELGGPGSVHATVTGGTSIIISNNTFSSQTDIDYLLDQLAIRMRETGEAV